VARLNALPYSTVCIKCQREIESEGGLLHGRTAADWARLGEGGNPMEDREVSIADLEIDLSK
jgi:DnaK suppressor protein